MKNVFQEIKKYIIPGRYVLAVSGGIDSIALAHACANLQKKNSEYKFYVVHIEHGLREKESQRDADFVKQFCNEYNLQCKIEHVNVFERVKCLGESVEDAARKLRYGVLFKAMQDFVAMRVLTAHHANDQAETLILRLVRGAGTKGLGAIHRDNGKILRPLLDCTRNDIDKYSKENNLQWVEDSSNNNIYFSRNYIRKEVLPLLQKLNPNIVETLNCTAKRLQEDEMFLKAVADKVALDRIKDKFLLTNDWQKLQPSVRKKIICKWLMQFGCQYDAVHIEMIDKIILRGVSNKKLALPGVTIKYKYHKLFIEQKVCHFRI